MSQLRIDYDAIAQSAKVLYEEAERINEASQRTKQEVTNLPEVWEAETSRRYVDQYMEEVDPALRNAYDTIVAIAKQMETISENFLNADTDMAGQM